MVPADPVRSSDVVFPDKLLVCPPPALVGSLGSRGESVEREEHREQDHPPSTGRDHVPTEISRRLTREGEKEEKEIRSSRATSGEMEATRQSCLADCSNRRRSGGQMENTVLLLSKEVGAACGTNSRTVLIAGRHRYTESSPFWYNIYSCCARDGRFFSVVEIRYNRPAGIVHPTVLLLFRSRGRRAAKYVREKHGNRTPANLGPSIIFGARDLAARTIRFNAVTSNQVA